MYQVNESKFSRELAVEEPMGQDCLIPMVRAAGDGFSCVLVSCNNLKNLDEVNEQVFN